MACSFKDQSPHVYNYASLVIIIIYVSTIILIASVEMMCIFGSNFYLYLATSEQGQDTFFVAMLCMVMMFLMEIFSSTFGAHVPY